MKVEIVLFVIFFFVLPVLALMIKRIQKIQEQNISPVIRGIIVFITFVIFYLVIGTVSSAQNEPLETKMFFSSRDDAEKAFYSGEFRYYLSDPKNIKTYPPFSAKGLPSAYVALEVVRENSGQSPAWVLLPSGMPAVFNFHGVPIQDGRCWNKILEAFPIKVSGRDGKDGRNGKDGKDGIGRDGKNGRDGRDAIIPDGSSVNKIVIPLGCALAGGLIGGYVFQKENEIITQSIIPSTKVQTGDGTFVFGPQKIKTDTHVERSFNWTSFAVGTASGFILWYLLNEVIF